MKDNDLEQYKRQENSEETAKVAKNEIKKLKNLKWRVIYTVCTMLLLSVYLWLSRNIVVEAETNRTFCEYDDLYTASEIFFYSTLVAMAVVLNIFTDLLLQCSGLRPVEDHRRPLENSPRTYRFRISILFSILALGATILAFFMTEECFSDQDSTDSVVAFVTVFIFMGLVFSVVGLRTCFGTDTCISKKF